MDNKKLIETANNLDIFAKIAGGFGKAIGIVCLIFIILVLILGEKIFVEGSLTLDLDFVKLHLADEFQIVTNLMKVYTILGLISASVICFIVYYIAALLRKILAPMKEGRPFEAHIPENLKKIAWAVIIGGGIGEILGVIERVLLVQAYPMEEIFSSSAITKLEYVFTIDINFLLIACVILFLSYIFSYGQLLQQESDETL